MIRRNYESHLGFCTSKDGTRVPVIVTHREGRQTRRQESHAALRLRRVQHPAHSPAFSVEYAVWMDMGGVVAVANLRGGGEYGEAWHLAGKKDKKQNVFDDFIAAAEWLIAEKVHDP